MNAYLVLIYAMRLTQIVRMNSVVIFACVMLDTKGK